MLEHVAQLLCNHRLAQRRDDAEPTLPRDLGRHFEDAGIIVREDHQLGAALNTGHALHDVDAVLVGRLQVQQDQRRIPTPDNRQGLHAAARFLDTEAGGRHHRRQEFSLRLVVIDDQGKRLNL